MEFKNQISVLTQNNWNTWKHDMQVLLMHYGCWQFIVQTKPEQLDDEATYKEKIRSTTSLSINKVASSGIPVYRATNLQMERRGLQSCQIEAELILANRLQLMKQDLEKAENAYLSSFTSKKSKTLPGATAAAHGDPNGKNDYQKKGGKFQRQVRKRPSTSEKPDASSDNHSLIQCTEGFSDLSEQQEAFMVEVTIPVVTNRR
ncbi:retrovirus-related Pol polyprotein from transposon TNT 1-94 [Trichonephila clavipes]|nr:retrovirus-related Pol polyprotein from transposon TNT 1-94 [Trichonephila clavipes]